MIRRRKKFHSPENGFTLIEVLLTLFILSVGLVFILRSYVTTLDAITRVEDISVLSNLLENKMEEVKNETIENNGIDVGNAFGEFRVSAAEKYDWHLKVMPSDVAPSLNKVQLTASWNEQAKVRKMMMTTYLKSTTEK